MSARARDHLGVTLADRYRLVRPLGFGATARVFLAVDTHLERHVAIKVLHPDLMAQPQVRRRFRAEAQAAAKLRHPHVVAVFDWSDAEREAFLVTEYLPGGSLRTMLDEHGPLSLSQTLSIGLDAANGLAAAHHEGIVHRDIKPANLLFTPHHGQVPAERLCIADFGIARIMAESSWTEPGGLLVGTARYAAPEQASGVDVGPTADVYSLALTMIEAATGAVPSVAASPLATMMRRQDADVTVPAELGPLRPILTAATQADPARRPSAIEFAAALAKAATSLPRPAPLPIAESGQPQGGDDLTIVDDLVVELDDTDADADDEPLLSDDLLAESTLIDSAFGAGYLDGDDPEDALAGAEPTVEHDAAPTTRTAAALANPDEFDEFAAAGLGDAGFEGDGLDGADDDFSDEFDDEPRRSRSGLFLVLALVALVAVGVAAIVLSQRDPEPVIETFPAGTYVGRTLDDVQSDLALRGWDATVAYERADGTEAGDVLQQVPPPGTELEAGAVITLVVSEGPLLHLVPNVVGLTKPDALSSLAAAGLQVGLIDSSVHDEEVVVGSVVSQAVEPGTELETGATVDLAISAGPEPRTVPDLSGLTLEEATLVLTDLGLVVVPAEDYSQTVPEGEVIGSDPGLDATIARDAEITVTVSLGLPFVTIPDVTDLDVTEADQILTDAGLVVVDIVGPLTTVLTTDPEPGETVRQGTEIRIITRNRR